MVRRTRGVRRSRTLVSILLAAVLLAQMSGVALADAPVANDDVLAMESKLPDPGTNPGDLFGASMAIDGDRVIIGAPGADVGTNRNAGMLYVYDVSGPSWSLEATLAPPADVLHLACEMGWSVDIDGDTIVAGAPSAINRISTTHPDTGLAVVYRFDGAAWNYQTTLLAGANGTTQRYAGERFGYAVAVTGDTIAVGAPYYASVGRVQFFSWNGSSWVREISGTSSPARGIHSNARMGYDLEASGDVVFVGVPGYVSGSYNAGAVELWDCSRSATPIWHTRTVPPSLARDYRFGEEIVADGDDVLIGSPGASSNDGAIWGWTLGVSAGRYALSRDGGMNSPATGIQFGSRIALDGRFALAGTPDADSGLGQTWLLWKSPTGWTSVGASQASDRAIGGGDLPQYGASVAMTGTAAFVAAPYDDDPVLDAGAVYAHEFWTMTEGDPALGVSAPGVLANDVDPEGDSVAASLTVEPSGDVTLVADGGFEYRPADDWFGVDTFGYVSVDATGTSNTADARIVVLPVNDPPSFDAGADVVVAEDQGVVTLPSWATSITAGPYEGSQALSFTIDNDNPALFAAQPWVSASDGQLSFRPAPHQNGTATVSVYLTDDDTMGGPPLTSTTSTFTITVTPVNDSPSFTSSGIPAVDEDAGPQVISPWALSIAPGPASATDEASQTLTFETTNDNPALFSQEPTVTADGMLLYESALNAYGSAEVTVTLTDDDTAGGPAVSYARSYTLTVNPVNDAPTGVADARTVDEDDTLVVASPGVLSNDSDIEGPGDIPYFGPLTAEIDMLPANGALFFFDNGSFLYAPNAEWSGVDTFTYRAFDGDLSSEITTVTITVDAVNDEPFIDQGPRVQGMTAEDTTYTATCTVTDADGDTPAWSVPTKPANGTASVESSGTTCTIRYVPEQDFNGSDAFTVMAEDGNGGADLIVIAVDVMPVNDTPVALDDAFAAAEDETLSVPAGGVLGNDTDVDGDVLTASLETTPAHGTLALAADGSFTYAPFADYNGPDAFTYRAWDTTQSAVATVAITVVPSNDAPVAAGEAYETDEEVALHVAAPGLLGNDTDIDGDVLASHVATEPVHGTLALAADGSFTYVPEIGWSGSDSFSYVAFDGTIASTPTVVDIVVDPIDTAYDRVAGAKRFDTAVAASRMSYPGTTTVDTVIITTAYNWPDALAGAGLAGAVDAPVLLSGTNYLPGQTADEIARLQARHVYILGGTNAVSDTVAARLGSLVGTGTVTRLGGADRYETAAMVASETVSVLGDTWDGTMMMATGKDFPDAIAASPLSAGAGWPLVLTPPSGVATSQASWLQSVGTSRTIVLGGKSSIAADAEAVLGAAGMDTERVSGSDRYATSVSIAEYGAAHSGLSWRFVGVATGQDFPDALAGGVYCAGRGGVMLLTPSGALSPAVAQAFSDHRAEIYEVVPFGGADAVSQDVEYTIRNLLR